MSDTDTAWWAVARRPRHPALGHIQTAYNRPQPDPAPEPDPVSDIGTVAAMDAAAYAAARDQVMAEHAGGPRRSSDWAGGVDLPAPRAALSRDELVALGMSYMTHDRPGPEPRPRGIPAAGHTSIGGVPFRGAATNTDHTTEGA